jgi:hypothetical protein
MREMGRIRSTLFVLFLASPLALAAGSTASMRGAQPVNITSANGAAAGTASTGQGSDQGEDQGENVHQFGAGPLRIGPTTVNAHNTIVSGQANGGTGGNVTAIFNNIVTAHCTAGATTAIVSPVPVQIRSGRGGDAGVTGSGQGTDQGEDQGENIAQQGKGVTNVAPTTVTAINRIESGLARGGNGGNVSLTFNQYTLCVGGPTVPTPPPPSTAGVQRDAAGNVVATFVTHTTCSSAPMAPIVIRAGNGGKGGTTGAAQATDQGEDQGENIGQFSSGSSHSGPTSVFGGNSLDSPPANGHDGRNITVTFDNFVDASCGSGPTSAASPIVVSTGAGGRGGYSGNGQGTDQGEDQGENIGQYAVGNTRIGPVRVTAQNSTHSGAVDGGNGGTVTVTFNDFGACTAGTAPAAAADERVSAAAGAGGAAGRTGRDQGADQGEDQGENIGQFAKGRAFLGAVDVIASNSNVSGTADGGVGGNVNVTFHAGACVPSATDESVAGSAGTGGRGGETGRRQGLDQGEDQGENIGQLAKDHVHFGHTTVHAINLNKADDALGGNGGNVTVQSGSCPAGGIDMRVPATPGAGGSGGTSGQEQGADQAEDQGENIGLRARSSGGTATVTNDGHNVAGRVDAGTTGVAHVTGCASSFARASFAPRAGSAAQASPKPAVDPDLTICRGTFRGKAIDMEVPFGAVCRLDGATVVNNIEVFVGATLIAKGVKVGHDIVADQAKGLRVVGGRIGHGIESEGLTGSLRGAGNAICGVNVAHNVLIQDSKKSAGTIVIGGPGCPGNRIEHDLTVAANSSVVVSNNRVGHDAICPFNTKFLGRGNRAMHVNSCTGTKGG